MKNEGSISECVKKLRRPSSFTLSFFLVVARVRFNAWFEYFGVANEDRLPTDIEGKPLIVFLNHASWWDPLPMLLLQMKFLPGRFVCAPSDAAALTQASHLRMIGFFPVDTGTFGGTKRFLRDCGHILAIPEAVLCITPEGEFRDPRARPLELRRGLAALLARTGSVTVLPLAIEYTIWDKRRPEMLASWGEPIQIEDGRSKSVDEWQTVLTDSLTATLDELADHSIKREKWRFRPLIYGPMGRRNTMQLISDIKSIFRHRL